MARGKANPLHLIDALGWFERELLITPRMSAKLRREVLQRCGMKRSPAPKPKPATTRKRRETTKAAEPRQQTIPGIGGAAADSALASA